VIWALLGYWLFSLFGSDQSSDDIVAMLSERVAAVVSDEARLQRIDAVLQSGKGSVDASQAAVSGEHQTFFEVLRRHDATREELGAVVGRVTLHRDDIQKRLLDMRFALREELTEAEWAEVFPR